jgi:hypothetical protein
MKAFQDVHTADRISTREELHQVIDLLLDLGDSRAAPRTAGQLETDFTSALWDELPADNNQDWLAGLTPVAELFPEDEERIN